MIFSSLPPLSLYIHLPWCEKKCPYCDFNSHVADDFNENAYITALIQDLQQDLPLVWGRQLISIFVGGGTPSLFSAAAINQLLSELRACLHISPAIEITMEANPGSADEKNFAAYREAGVNRLSIGIQSFNDTSLQSIGRIHDAEQAQSAVLKARQAGFENINLDLIYALPKQTLDQCLSDVAQAIDLEPEHISHYQLTIEPNTLFHKQPPARLPDNDSSWEMQIQSQRLLALAGYAQYEISAYAQPGKQCAHNMNYWHFGDYVGIGAGAHGKITLPSEQRILRRTRIRQPKAYLNAPHQCISEERELSDSGAVFEFMLNALRLIDGFDLALFTEYCGLPIKSINTPLKMAQQKGLISVMQNHIKPTDLGLQFHNDLLEIFLDVKIDLDQTIEPEIHF